MASRENNRVKKSSRVEKRVSSLFERSGLVFGIVLTLTALVIGLLTYFTLEQKTEVAAQVLASDELTTYHPDMEAKFTYEGEEVTHLWKLKVRFVNSGDKTIIGTGNQSDLVGNGLNFVFPDDTRMLRIEKETETFQSNVVQVKPNHFQIQFSQWRSGEYSIVSFCVASDKWLETHPFPSVPTTDSVPTRDIIDGDVFIDDLTERRPLEQITFIDRLPRVVSIAGKIMGGISAGLLVLGLLIILIWAWMDTFKKYMWKRQYLSSFRIYLNQVEPKISKSKKILYMEYPESLPDGLWTKFEGKKAIWRLAF
ncbi:unnamed protein product, partial [marine sediment metagenome]